MAPMDLNAEEILLIKEDGNMLGKLISVIGMKDDTWEAIKEQMGEMTTLREVVSIPLDDWKKAVDEAKVITSTGTEATTVRTLKPLEKGQVGLVRRGARTVLGLPSDETGPFLYMGDKAKDKGATDSHGGIVPNLSRKVRLSRVVDQGDEAEVDPMEPGIMRALIKKYKTANDHLDAQDAEEATPDQVQGIKAKLLVDVVPYADLGILRPFGRRLERALKFQAQIWDPLTREFVRKEVPGPSNFKEWIDGWRVYTFIMIALEAASRARLGRYAEKIQDLLNKYGEMGGVNTWWMVALADQRMRAERMERIRRDLEEAFSEGRKRESYGFDPSKPWDAVFLAATEDDKFWYSEVTEKAVFFMSHSKPREVLTDEGHNADLNNAPGMVRKGVPYNINKEKEYDEPSKSKLRRLKEKDKKMLAKKEKEQAAVRPHAAAPKGDGGGKDGKGKGKRKGKGSIQLCYAWNRDSAGCPDPCPTGRLHMCEYCGGDHKASSNSC